MKERQPAVDHSTLADGMIKKGDHSWCLLIMRWRTWLQIFYLQTPHCLEMSRLRKKFSNSRKPGYLDGQGV